MPEIVRAEDERRAGLAAGQDEGRHDLLAGGRIEARRRLVGEDHARLGDQRAGDGNPLRLPAGERVGAAKSQIGKSDHVERRQRAGAYGFRRQCLQPVARPGLPAKHAVDDIGQDRHARHEVVLLGNEADAGAQAALGSRPEACDRLAEQQHLAGGRLDQAETTFEERRLAGAVGADQRHLLTARHREIHAAEIPSAHCRSAPTEPRAATSRRPGSIGGRRRRRRLAGSHQGERHRRDA